MPRQDILRQTELIINRIQTSKQHTIANIQDDNLSANRALADECALQLQNVAEISEQTTFSYVHGLSACSGQPCTGETINHLVSNISVGSTKKLKSNKKPNDIKHEQQSNQ